MNKIINKVTKNLHCLVSTGVVALGLVSIVGCVVQKPLQKRLLTGDIPQFNEYISPISVPIQPMYKPTVSNLKISIATSYKISSTKEKHKGSEYIEITIKQKIEKLGDLLVWNGKLNKITMGGKTIAPSRPLIEVRTLTDKYGNIQEMDATCPALAASNLTQREIDEFIDSMKELLKKNVQGFPNHPVRSGDAIHKINRALLSESLSEAKETPKPIKYFFTQESFKPDIESIIKGSAFFNKKKVIVASMNENSNGNAGGFNFQLKINGYNLYDAETFQIVDGYLLVEVFMSHPWRDENMSLKILSHQTAKLIN